MKRPFNEMVCSDISLHQHFVYSLAFSPDRYWLDLDSRLSKASDCHRLSGRNSFTSSLLRSSEAKDKDVAFGVLGDVYVVLFIGMFLTPSPSIYRSGIIALVPDKGKPAAKNVLDKLGSNLQKWLKGKLFSMFVVFALTAIGLVIMGMPAWLALALMAGLLSFVPNFGPLIAIIPAVLLGLLESPSMAAMVAGLYVFVQVAESNFITPFIQQKLVNTPPAMILIAQLIMGTLTGGWGVVLATPVMVITMVLVRELYIKEPR